MVIFVLLLCSAWTESFETQYYFPPNDWIIVNEDCLDALWYRDMVEGHTGIHSATCYGDTLYSGLDHTNIDHLITPRVLPQGGDTLLSFWHRSSSIAGCSLDVLVSTSTLPTMPSFNLVQTFYITETSWIQQILSLNAYNGVPIYISFRIRRVPVNQQLYLDDIMLPEMTSQPSAINGFLRTKGPPTQKYLQVWGSHYEMGYAHGFLLAEEIIAQYNYYLLGSSLWYIFTPVEWENNILPYWRIRFTVPVKYQEEAQGIYDGLVDKGVNLTHPGLAREITAEDILCYNTLPDLCHFMAKSGEWCSSISGWGQSTINDDTLQGGMVLCRNLDHYSGVNMSFTNTSLIIAYFPEVTNEQRHVSISCAGWFGCTSVVNQDGVGICFNTGNYPDTNYIAPNSLIPVMFSLRDAAETIDPDNSGVNDIYDITYSVDYSTSLYSNAIHLFSPYDVSHPTPAGIFEINNVADSLRLVADNIIPPLINSQYNLGVTNHQRVLYPPISCWRYQRIADSLNADFHLSTQRAIAIESAIASEYSVPWYGWCTAQQMVIRPNVITEHPDWPCIGVGYARRRVAAHNFPKFWYSWNELFEGVPGIEEVAANKPIKSQNAVTATIFRGPLRLPVHKKCKVFDIMGRVVEPSKIRPGIYFIEVDGVVTQKIIKIR